MAPTIDAIILRNQQALYRHAIYADANLLQEYHPARVFIKDRFYIDPFQLQKPHCVLCAAKQGVFEMLTDPKLIPNRDLKAAWLIWDSTAEGLVPLGHYGNHDLYMTRQDYNDGVLTNFILFTMNYTEPTETFSQGGSESKQVIVNIDTNAGERKIDKKTGKLAPPESRVKSFSIPSAPSLSLPATNGRIAPATPFTLTVPQTILPSQ